MLLLGILATGLAGRPRTGAEPVNYALVATWQGEWVCLYSTPDPVEFGQIRRALQRAIEWHDDASV